METEEELIALEAIEKILRTGKVPIDSKEYKEIKEKLNTYYKEFSEDVKTLAEIIIGLDKSI
jgi:hypothetical protein